MNRHISSLDKHMYLRKLKCVKFLDLKTYITPNAILIKLIARGKVRRIFC